MASTEATDVLRRLLEDDYIHEQISEASAGVRGVYRRARRLPPEKAVQDKLLYERLRAAVSGVTEAGRHALGKPEPPKPKRGSKLLALTVLGATVAVVVWAAKRDGEARANRAAASASPVPPA
jgi:hypothetical protein